ncbi:MAG: hypothetical protein WEB57_03745 [Pseudohongiellaceae bacterium]
MTMELTSPGNFSLLSVSGPDARRFLQGQLSCNMDDLTGQRSLPGAYCNLKGRVIADFLVIENAEQVLLRCEPGMAESLRGRLAKYAVFFKVELEDVSAQWQRAAVIGDRAVQRFAEISGLNAPQADRDTVRQKELIVVRIPGPRSRLELLVPAKYGLPPHEETGSERDWQLEDIRAGIAHVGATCSEQYTPQVLNYDLDGTINFRKGCYTGQEVVARMHYRGKASKRLYRLVTEAPIASGDLSGWQVVCTDRTLAASGEILAQEAAEHGAELLAILPRKLAEQPEGTLCLSTNQTDAEDIPVTRLQGFE